MGLQPLLLCSALPWIDEATSGLGSFQISFGVSPGPPPFSSMNLTRC